MKTLNNLFLPLLLSACFFTLATSRKECAARKKLSTSKLLCYYGNVDDIDGCHCSHVILPHNADVKSIERVRGRAKGVKVYVSVNEFNQGLINLLKSSKVDGLEINLKKLDSKNDISDFISTVKSKIGSDLDIALSVPSKADLVAKYFDFKALSKHTDLFILQTAFLGASENVTFHPSRLSGMWDMQNTDSVVDLITGLGAPLSKLVIAAPVQAFQFTLQNEEYSAPGSPAVALKSITRDELCKLMRSGKNWTLERDEDQAGPYIFRKNQWIAFEDPKSMDIKAKYSRIRGLAGIALKDLAQDGGAECESTILKAAYNGLSQQARAPRGAVLHSLEREILESPIKLLDSVQLSPYKISRIIDTEGKIHVTRQDSRTEFQCSRQGYFVHPRSCNRFYRCVKFDQRSEDFNVFEFDCPAGLAFDERVEVCVWPGSLPHGTPCSGSSEIAPVPRKRFECPSEPGYYADPENCRWFFACLDHGKSPLSAYEFRCPFGLGFDGERLVCEWPWLVSKCASGLGSGLDSEYYYGGANGYSGYAALGANGGDAGVGGNGGYVRVGENGGYAGVGGNGGYAGVGGNGGYAGVGGNGLYAGVGGNGGYAGKGSLPAGFVLQNYDGLGTLESIRLGGISGKIEKPVATVYSNVGSGALGLGYQNNGGYIVGGGLSYKAAQALENAGLLKVNNGAGYQASGQNEQGTVYSASDLNSGNVNIQYSSGNYGAYDQKLGSGYKAGSELSGSQGAGISTQSFTQYTGQQGADGGAFLINADGKYGSVANAYANTGQLQTLGNLQYQGVTAQYEGSNLHLVQGSLDGTGYASTGAGASEISQQGFNQYHGTGQPSESYAFSSGISSQAQGEYQDAHNQVAQGNIAYVTTGDSQGAGNGALHYNIQGGQGSNGAVSSQSFTRYHGEDQQGANYGYQSGSTGSHAGAANNGYEATRQGIQVTGYAGAAHANLGNQEVADIHLIGSTDQGTSGYINSGSYVSGKTDFTSQYGNNDAGFGDVKYQGYEQQNAGGAVSTQSFTQYHGQQDSKAHGNYDSGVRGNINIVGGGYSAVGTLAGVHVSNNGDADDVKTVSFSSTPAPISVTTYAPVSTVSSVPTVTAVPVPGIKTSAGFETFRGGVIANIPELQYKVKSHEDTAFLANISSSFANFVVTTPAPVAKEVNQQTYSQDGGYVYETPGKVFEEGSLNAITVSTARPFVTISTQEPTIYASRTDKPIAVQQGYIYDKSSVHLPETAVVYSTSKPAVSVVTYQKYDTSGGYNYEKPTIAFEEKPQGVVVDNYSTVSTAKPAVIVAQQPQSYVSSTPAAPAVTSYSFTQETNQNQGGYYYNQPAVPYLEGPRNPTVISKFTIRKPTVQQTVNTGSYYYEKPAVKLAERPIVVHQQPEVLNEIPTVHLKQNTVVENYVYQPPAQPSLVSQYYNQQPSVQQQPIVPLYKQPELLSTYTYQPPVQKTVYKQPVSTYTYKNVAQESLGLTYTKPQVSLVQQPVQTYSYQPSGGTSYQYIKFEDNLQEKPIAVRPQGYEYPKPSIAFEEQPQLNVVPSYQYSTPKPNVLIPETRAEEGYDYEKPTVIFEETPVTYSTPKPIIAVQQPVVTSYYNIGSLKSRTDTTAEQQQGYEYSKPLISFEDKPVPPVVTSYQYSTPKPSVVIQETKAQGGYIYDQPALSIKETPLTYSTPKPNIAVQPAVVTSYFNTGISKSQAQAAGEQEHVGYSYPQPTVKLDETPIFYSTPKPFNVQPAVAVQPLQPAVVTSYFNIQSSTPKPNVYVPQPITYSTPKPIAVQAVVPIEKVGYDYPKPEVRFEETPVTFYTPKPAIAVQPVVSNTYSYSASSTTKPDVAVHQNVGYAYQQPEIRFEETPVQPAVVSSYNYIGSTTPQSNIIVEDQQPINYTPKPQVFVEHKPAVVTSYFHQQPSQPVASKGYAYPKPSVQFVEEPQPVFTSYDNREPVQEVPFVKKTAYVTGQYQPNAKENYNYQQSSEGSYQHQDIGKVVVENYVYPDYEKVKQALFGDKIYQQQEEVQYQQPQVVLNYVQSTPRPTFVSTVKAIATKKFQPVTPASVTFYDSRYTSTPASYVSSTVAPDINIVRTTSRPISRYSFSSLDDQYQYNQNIDVVKYPTAEPTRTYLPVLNYVQSTPRPTFVSTVKAIATKKLQPVTPASVTFYDSRYTSTPASYVSSTVAPEINIVSTTSRPISRYSFSSLDDQYQYNQNIDIVKYTTPEPTRTYLPVTSRVRVTSALPKLTRTKVVEAYVAPEVTTLARDYLPVRIRTKVPAREYLPVEVTMPSRDYLPSRQRVRVTSTTAAPEVTTLYREYLPVRSRVTITEPTTLRVVRPTTVIKQNDAHPLLSAKLGAQCTCVSNSLRLRKNQRIIIVDDDDQNDDNDDDGYVVDDGSQGNIVENYSYEPQRVVDITPTPEVYVHSTSVAPRGYSRKRVKVRPVLKRTYLPVTEVSEVFYKKDSSPVEDSSPSDREIAKAVRTGLKLVKQAAKEGAIEGTQEALSSKQFDRFGPGGVRSRSETLQGTIDCQRAGLFRHPTECNKFYACRWDCTKSRFTLHVFNCPVHLTFDNTMGACNWPSQGPACVENTLITSD